MSKFVSEYTSRDVFKSKTGPRFGATVAVADPHGGETPPLAPVSSPLLPTGPGFTCTSPHNNSKVQSKAGTADSWCC